MSNVLEASTKLCACGQGIENYQSICSRCNGKLQAALEPTPKMMERAAALWSGYAGEPVRLERISGVLYAFGSEIACLRLYHKMRGKGRAAFSTNMQTWYYCNE